MEPVYVKKSDPQKRTTWMDKFIASNPGGGVRDVIEMARDGRARAVFTAILAIAPDSDRVAA